jgi:hypothetical protein
MMSNLAPDHDGEELVSVRLPDGRLQRARLLHCDPTTGMFDVVLCDAFRIPAFQYLGSNSVRVPCYDDWVNPHLLKHPNPFVRPVLAHVRISHDRTSILGHQIIRGVPASDIVERQRRNEPPVEAATKPVSLVGRTVEYRDQAGTRNVTVVKHDLVSQMCTVQWERETDLKFLRVEPGKLAVGAEALYVKNDLCEKVRILRLPATADDSIVIRMQRHCEQARLIVPFPPASSSSSSAAPAPAIARPLSSPSPSASQSQMPTSPPRRTAAPSTTSAQAPGARPTGTSGTRSFISGAGSSTRSFISDAGSSTRSFISGAVSGTRSSISGAGSGARATTGSSTTRARTCTCAGCTVRACCPSAAITLAVSCTATKASASASSNGQPVSLAAGANIADLGRRRGGVRVLALSCVVLASSSPPPLPHLR